MELVFILSNRCRCRRQHLPNTYPHSSCRHTCRGRERGNEGLGYAVKGVSLVSQLNCDFTNLSENEAFVLKRRKASSAGDALLLELLAGLWPGIRVFITLLLEVNASILQEQPINWLVQEHLTVQMGVDICETILT